MAIERRYCELRAEGERVISGVLVRYGDVASIGGLFRERIEAGAFAPLPTDCMLNFQHDRSKPLARLGAGLVLADSASELRLRAELPRTALADDVLALCAAGVCRGLSLEFNTRAERQDGDLRVIVRGVVAGAAVVDSPAYGQSTIDAMRAAQAGTQHGERPDRVAAWRRWA